MKNWLSRQNGFTQLTAVGTAVSAAVGMAALAALIIAIITAFLVGQQTIFGIVYPSVLDEIAKAALYSIGLSIVSFLTCTSGLIAGLLFGNKPTQEQREQDSP